VGACLPGPKFGPLQGDPCGDLGYEFKYWVGFDFWFDMLTSHIGAND